MRIRNLYSSLVSFIYKIHKQVWIISSNNYYLNNNSLNKKNYFLENYFIAPDLEGKIIIRKNKKVKRGWYFLGIYHSGDNKKSLLKIKNTKYSIQSRPAFPYKRRWRVIRISRESDLILELSQIKKPAKFKEIWFIKIPIFFAFFKIKKRVEKSFCKKYTSSLNQKNTWRKYNKILFNQFSKHKKVYYPDWIRFLETPIYKSILKNISTPNLNYKNFIILNSIRKVFNEDIKWVVILRKNVILSDKFDNILKWIDNQEKKVDLFYGDEDHMSENNIRYDPIFKSGWNRELFWSDRLYSSHWVISKEIWNLFFEETKNLDNFDFDKVIFSIIEKLILERNETYIRHIPFIISHRLNNFYSHQNTENEITKLENLSIHLKKIYSNKFIRINHNSYEKIKFIEWAIPKDIHISIIIPTKDNVELLRNCINSIHKFSYSSNMEILIINNNSVEKETFLFLDELKNKSIKNISHRILNFNEKFNYSKINNFAVKQSIGDTLILVNNDIEFLSEKWDIYLSSNANREDIGCVGAKLLFDDFTIQHAGVVLGIGGVAGHSHKYFESNSSGYCGRLNMSQEYSSVTAACLCITKSKWEKIGGFDEQNLAINYNDVDLCLKSKQNNLRNIYLPHVLAIHHESKTRGKPKGKSYDEWRKEYKFMKKKWGDELKKDIFYNPHLTLEEEDWSISINEYNLSLR